MATFTEPMCDVEYESITDYRKKFLTVVNTKVWQRLNNIPSTVARVAICGMWLQHFGKDAFDLGPALKQDDQGQTTIIRLWLDIPAAVLKDRARTRLFATVSTADLAAWGLEDNSDIEALFKSNKIRGVNAYNARDLDKAFKTLRADRRRITGPGGGFTLVGQLTPAQVCWGIPWLSQVQLSCFRIMITPCAELSMPGNLYMTAAARISKDVSSDATLVCGMAMSMMLVECVLQQHVHHRMLYTLRIMIIR